LDLVTREWDRSYREWLVRLFWIVASGLREHRPFGNKPRRHDYY
jgi:hypothetical protein